MTSRREGYRGTGCTPTPCLARTAIHHFILFVLVRAFRVAGHRSERHTPGVQPVPLYPCLARTPEPQFPAKDVEP